ncbi:signal peptidase I [Intestinibacillus massiliensis]|uniref:signal peptidase I n=1 Tax=Intestinibacillus massiliensis TaxID=1871029 RepID=UPI000B35FCC2|nr:signal peptidase I [Intestinibacillus massiliensis]MCB6365482.1 signal peptidase I [Intestinibacillus massiliensis]
MYEEQEAGQAAEKPGRYKSEFFEWGEALVISLTVIILLFTFVVRLIGVDGSSMYPTLHDRDKVFMSNLFYTPEKGDIVVLTKSSFIDGPIVKRVIATAGDTIDINFSTMEVSVNGEVLDEPYVNPETTAPLLSGDMIFPQTVPEGCVFVMGDNRNHSSDSRVASLGMVDERYILGHVLVRVLPLDRIGGIS